MIAVAGGIILAYLVIKYPMELFAMAVFLLVACFWIVLALLMLGIILGVIFG